MRAVPHVHHEHWCPWSLLRLLHEPAHIWPLVIENFHGDSGRKELQKYDHRIAYNWKS